MRSFRLSLVTALVAGVCIGACASTSDTTSGDGGSTPTGTATGTETGTATGTETGTATGTTTGTATGSGGQGGEATGGQGGEATGGQGGEATGGQGGEATGGQGGQATGGQGGQATGGQGGQATGGQGGQATGGEGGQGGSATGGSGGSGGGLACESATVPTDCETGHGYNGCCVGSVAYYWSEYYGEIEEDDCAASGEECGWEDGWGYVCGGSGVDPDHPNDMCCGGANPYGDCGGDCSGAPEPTDCETAHGLAGCCVGSVLYYYYAGDLYSYDCADDGDPCGWDSSYGSYDCGYTGADPDYPDDMCCGGTNPYGDCGGGSDCSGAPVPTDCETAHGYYGCCVGTVSYYWDEDDGAVYPYDCADDGEECGWYDGWGYVCGGSGADPEYPNDMCCGGTNPYGDC